MQQGTFGGLLAATHLAVRQRADQLRQEGRFRSGDPVGQKHFIVKPTGIVMIETRHALALPKGYAPVPQPGGAPVR